ncbi:HNH endonuclease [Kosakonia sp. S58]|uniref:HNH endonuclease n=1 Tax=unclassified Kosakonia TaxID=2632876 RepID=UPI0019033917|nr:HNH endonuclease [Kosakonia sp. S42]MBK0080892.1 HNH endonuclease [Kosakonia sp. S57]MBK0088710.1 HNH endonuclease [Kosakonia sp. S58]UGS46333.1 HNH endonuclease [Kosakonia cowanii]
MRLSLSSNTLSIKNVRIILGKIRDDVDFGRADIAAGYSPNNPRPRGYTWHHHQDSGYMQLVPTEIHDAVRHSGGIATNRR